MQAEQKETFEQILFSYVEMCYLVALALTRDPDDARCLTREVLVDTWLLNACVYNKRIIKQKLLTTLRTKFKEGYSPPKCGARRCTALTYIR